MFIEAEFPRTISYKALGGPAFNTTVNEGKSGFEQRNQNWQVVRGEWSISLETPGSSSNVNPQTYIDQLTAFFLIVGGKANGFRLKDHKDFTNGSIAQQIGVSNGSTTLFQLVKAYSAAGLTYSRTISKPMTSAVVNYLGSSLTDTVDIYLNGGSALPRNAGYVGGGTSKYSLDQTTGLISFGSSTSILAISGFSIINGYRAFNYTLTAGPVPELNQQVIINGLSTTAANGAWTITGLGSGYILTNSASSTPDLTDSGKGYLAWSLAVITAVSFVSTTATYSYTLTAGQALTANMRVTVAGFVTHTGNNGTFIISSLGAGTFTVTNANASTGNETHSATGTTDWVPATGSVITWTGQFHFPVRFDTDKLAIQLEESNIEGGFPIVTWNSIQLKELRILPGQSQG